MPLNISLIGNAFAKYTIEGDYDVENYLPSGNYATLMLSIQINDAQTRMAYPPQIVSIQISNDPLFNPAQTVEYINLIYTPLTPAKIHEITVNESDFGLTTTPTIAKVINTTEVVFAFHNWPISNSGGVSKIYFVLDIHSNNEDQSYPIHGVGEAIVSWESEKLGRPGTSIANIITENFCGSNATWRFTGSNDTSTGMGNYGISRYMLDIIETRSILSTATANTAILPLARNIINDEETLNVTPYDVNDGIAGSADGSWTKESIPITNTNGKQFETDAFTSTLNMPDYCMQSHFIPSFPSNAEEYLVVVPYFTVNSFNYQCIFYIKPDSVAAKNNMTGSQFSYPTIPINSILSGGALELFIHSGTNQSVVAVYYSPTGSDESYLLDCSTIDKIDLTSNYITAGVQYYLTRDVSNYAIQHDEMLVAWGRFNLNADIGDCIEQNLNNISFPITQISQPNYWTNQIGTGLLWEFTCENGTYDTSDNMLSLTIDNSPYSGYSGVMEIQTTTPTFSENFNFSWQLEQEENWGDFYVSFSPVAATNVPMIARFNPNTYSLSIPRSTPTIAVVFSHQVSNIPSVGSDMIRVSILQQNLSNVITQKFLTEYPYDSNLHNYSLTVNKEDYGIWLILKSDSDNLGQMRLEEPITLAGEGLGFYFAMGIRQSNAEQLSVFTNKISECSLRAFPKSYPLQQNQMLNSRYFTKSSMGKIEAKPYLGQIILAGNVNQANSNFENSSTYDVGTYAQLINLDRSIDRSVENPIAPILLELKVNSEIYNNQPGFVQVSAYQCNDDGTIGNNFTDWIIGTLTPYRDLVQIPLDPSLFNGITTFWLIIKIPPQSSLISAWVKSPQQNITSLQLEAFSIPEPEYAYGTIISTNNSSLQLNILDNWLNIIANSPSSGVYCGTDFTFTDDGTATYYIEFDYSSDIDYASGGLEVMLQDVSLSGYVALTPIESNILLPQGMGHFKAAFNFDNGNYEYNLMFRITDIGAGLSFDFYITDFYIPVNTNIVNNIWYKIYADYTERHDNVFHGAALQIRQIAQSQAISSILTNINTSEPTPLSSEIVVDIEPPTITGLTVLPNFIGQTTTLNIKANDNNSGIMAFRIGYEIENRLVYTKWIPWSTFASSNSVIYDLIHNNYYKLSDSKQCGGKRKIRIQVVDGVGNVSESNPITTIIYNVAITDFNPPVGSFSLTGTSRDVLFETNNNNLNIQAIDDYDEATDIKDIRFRDIQGGILTNWSSWISFGEFIPYVISNAKGLHRIEVQIRDYGNNIILPNNAYDLIMSSINRNMIFTTGAIANDKAYLASIKSETFNNLTFKLFANINYGIGTAAFTLNSANSTIFIKPNDRIPYITLQGINYVNYSLDTNPSTNYYYIDPNEGTLVFVSNSLPTSPVSETVTVKRETANLYCWDKNYIIKVSDLGFLNEQAILSMCEYEEVLYLGCNSGNVYTFANNALGYPLVKINLPISALFIHQFQNESEPYIYAGTSQTPSLYRAPISTASQGVGWEKLTYTGGNITSMTSAYNNLFIGTDSGVYIYQRTDNNAVLTQSSLTQNITSLCSAGHQVLAGLANTPELWSYTINYKKNNNLFIEIPFNYYELQEPSIWQYYNNGKTILDTNVNLLSIPDPFSPNGHIYIKAISGNSQTITIFNSGKNSNWYKLISNQTTSWCFDIEMMFLSGMPKARQGFKISDGQKCVDISLSKDTIYVKSGNSFISKQFNTSEVPITIFSESTNEISIMDIVSNMDNSVNNNLIFPNRGIKQIWNFIDNKEDYGPFWYNNLIGSGYNGGNSGYANNASTQNWYGDVFISSISASLSNNLSLLNVTPTSQGNPRIFWTNSSINPVDIELDNESKFLIRMRYGNSTIPIGSSNAKLKLAVSSELTTAWSNQTWIETSILETLDFVTYEIKVPYCGKINSVAIEIENIPETNVQTIYFDYIAIVEEIDFPTSIDISNNLVPIRIGVQYTIDAQNNQHNKLKIWMGETEFPIIDEIDFLDLTTNTSQIVFGKTHIYSSEIDPTTANTTQLEPSSIWGYGRIQFMPGIFSAPLVREIQDFAPSWKFLSTGGVNKIVSSQGTIWVFTDGLQSLRITDNPQDQYVKCYSYDINKQIWREQTPDAIANSNLIRALVALPYKGDIIVAGQSALET